MEPSRYDRLMSRLNQDLTGDRSLVTEAPPNAAQTPVLPSIAQALMQHDTEDANVGGAPVHAMLNHDEMLLCDDIEDQEMTVTDGASAGTGIVTSAPACELGILDHNNFENTLTTLVSHMLKGAMGPLCEENRDAFHQLELKMQKLHADDPTKENMRTEEYTYKIDGTKWVNFRSIFDYMFTGAPNHAAKMQRMLFEKNDIPHKLLLVPGVRTIFLFVP
jgi:hypothetical protein